MRKLSTSEHYELADSWRDDLWDIADDAPQSIEDAWVRAVTLRQQLRQLDEASRDGAGIKPSPTGRIAAAPGTYDDNVSKLLDYASSKNLSEADYAAALVELGKAAQLAERAMLKPWFALGDGLRDLIQPAYEAKAAELIEAVSRVPFETKDLEDAARRGCHEAWLTAESTLKEIRVIQALLQAWVEYGAMPGISGKDSWHSAGMLLYRDPLAALKAAGAEGGWAGEALRLEAGGARLNTWAEMVEIMAPLRAEYDHVDGVGIARERAWQRKHARGEW